MKLSKLKFLFASAVYSHLVQKTLSWILEQHVVEFSNDLTTNSPQTYAGAPTLSRYSRCTSRAVWALQLHTSFAEDPRLLLQDQPWRRALLTELWLLQCRAGTCTANSCTRARYLTRRYHNLHNGTHSHQADASSPKKPRRLTRFSCKAASISGSSLQAVPGHADPCSCSLHPCVPHRHWQHSPASFAAWKFTGSF